MINHLFRDIRKIWNDSRNFVFHIGWCPHWCRKAFQPHNRDRPRQMICLWNDFCLPFHRQYMTYFNENSPNHISFVEPQAIFTIIMERFFVLFERQQRMFWITILPLNSNPIINTRSFCQSKKNEYSLISNLADFSEMSSFRNSRLRNSFHLFPSVCLEYKEQLATVIFRRMLDGSRSGQSKNLQNYCLKNTIFAERRIIAFRFIQIAQVKWRKPHH